MQLVGAMPMVDSYNNKVPSMCVDHYILRACSPDQSSFICYSQSWPNSDGPSPETTNKINCFF